MRISPAKCGRNASSASLKADSITGSVSYVDLSLHMCTLSPGMRVRPTVLNVVYVHPGCCVMAAWPVSCGWWCRIDFEYIIDIMAIDFQMPQKNTNRSSNINSSTYSGAHQRTRHSLDLSRRVPELDTVQKVMDFYGNHPHTALSKVQEFIDENPSEVIKRSTLR